MGRTGLQPQAYKELMYIFHLDRKHYRKLNVMANSIFIVKFLYNKFVTLSRVGNGPWHKGKLPISDFKS